MRAVSSTQTEISSDSTETTTLMSLGSLKVTTPAMHRIWVTVGDSETWYAVMREARLWFGQHWHCQGKVRRKLKYGMAPMTVWFDVPDQQFATWISVKLAVQAKIKPNKY